VGRTTNGIEVDQQSVASDGGGTPQLARRRLYVSVTVKFVVAQVVAAGWIVGPYTLAVLPLTLVVNAILYRFQRRRVFNLLGLRIRRNILGFLGFVLTYQMLMSPIAVVGYAQELLGLRRRWK